MNSYFISFATKDGNRGVVCTDATSELAALTKVTDAGLNPGGEAAIWRCLKSEANDLGRDKLITPEEMRAQDYKSRSQVSKAKADAFMAKASIVCEHMNRT